MAGVDEPEPAEPVLPPPLPSDFPSLTAIVTAAEAEAASVPAGAASVFTAAA
ncbi:MAG TPA: hypothetical protein VHE35_09780 [Kofleriaceae bacterium]|nr:hypothetical protein [Kofleriaceae bacterium]